MKFFNRALVCSVLIFAMFNAASCDILSANENIAEKIESLGYEAEQDGGKYVITDGDTQFTLRADISGKAKLEKITRELSPHREREIVDNIGVITIRPIDSKYVEVSLDDTVLETFDNGNNINLDEHISVVCGTDFSEDSINPYDSASVLGKATKYLYRITTYWMSAEELQELYAEGVYIVDSING